jgi:GDP-D-mannose dehydratase
MDENGNKMRDKGFEREKAETMTYTLKQRKIDSFLTTTKFMTVKDVIAKDEYTLLFNVNEKEKINEIYYYDDKTDKDYLLWEREN